MSVQVQYFALSGGENLVAPALSISAGELLLSENYEEKLEGGYSRCEGYERFDGHPSPTDTGYKKVTFSEGQAQFIVGDIVTGSVSGAVAHVIVDGVLESGSYANGTAAGFAVFASILGTFNGTEPLNVLGAAVANQAGAVQQASDDNTHSLWQGLATDKARSLISSVPGSGAIRGVMMLNGVVFAFRDNAAGTTCELYKSSATGWKIISTPSLLPGGDYQFVKYNFSGHSSTNRIYGCDGVNKGFEFNGVTFSQITTGMVDDKPQGVVAYRKHLFYAFSGGSIQHSGLGDPLSWSPITGAAEIALGDDWTGFAVQPNNTLLITTRNQMYLLYGTSAIDWNLTSFSDTTGAIKNSMIRVRDTYLMNDNGITSMAAVQAFGDFSLGSVSRKIQPVIDSSKGLLTCATRVETKTQLRFFFSDKRIIIGTIKGDNSISFTRGLFPEVVRNIWNGEDNDGNEVIYFGSDNGFIYQMDKGTSFDGAAIEAVVRLSFNNIGSPRHRKRFRKIVFELDSPLSTSIKFQPEFSYGAVDVALPESEEIAISGGGGYWGTGNWDEMSWSGQAISSAEASVDGTGVNMGILVYSKTALAKPHTLQGATIHYSMRRLSR